MLSCSTARWSAVRPDFCSCVLMSAPAATSCFRHGMLLLITAMWMAFWPAAQAQGQSQSGRAAHKTLSVELKEVTELVHRKGRLVGLNASSAGSLFQISSYSRRHSAVLHVDPQSPLRLSGDTKNRQTFLEAQCFQASAFSPTNFPKSSLTEPATVSNRNAHKRWWIHSRWLRKALWMQII